MRPIYFNNGYSNSYIYFFMTHLWSRSLQMFTNNNSVRKQKWKLVWNKAVNTGLPPDPFKDTVSIIGNDHSNDEHVPKWWFVIRSLLHPHHQPVEITLLLPKGVSNKYISSSLLQIWSIKNTNQTLLRHYSEL